MTRKNPSRCVLVLSSAVILLSSFLNAPAQEAQSRSSESRSAQTPGARNSSVRPPATRLSRRRLIKIKTRAGDTLSLLGDRFGASEKEIADLNGIAVVATLAPGTQLLIPLPSSETLARPMAEWLAQHKSNNLTGVDGIASGETEAGWEDVQGVLFRKRGTAVSSERDRAESVTGAESGIDSTPSGNASLGKIVEVTEADRSTVAQPVWIYLVGGARVEADYVNETTEGVWYKRGNLSIFIERARIERIERERAATVSEDSRPWTERGWSTGSAKFDALIRANGARFGVDPYLIFCVMEQESQFKPGVVSPKGARGLMQLMPGTAAHFGVRRPFDPAENIMGGTKYLKQLLANFNGRVDLVLAGYNAGEGAVMKFGGKVPPYKETRNYVRRISKRYGQSRSVAAPAAESPGMR